MSDDIAETLREYATHFAERDWAYTRNHDITRISYADNKKGYHRFTKRLKRTLAVLFGRPRKKDSLAFLGPNTLQERLIFARVAMEIPRNLPDGILDGGNVITHWEETGEYLQLMQPMVGEIIAEWLIAEPDNPYAQRVRAKMTELWDAYGKRVNEEKI